MPMAIRKNEALGFVDVMLASGSLSTALLEKLDAAAPRGEMATPIATLPESIKTGPGVPSWSPVVMLKYLVLGNWTNLPDPGLRKAFQIRISFRRFVGLSFTDETLNESTFVMFRVRLLKAGIHEQIFDTVVRHHDSPVHLV
jgi:transposase, IS5 family